MDTLKSFRRLLAEDNDQLLALSRACPLIADFTFFFDRAPDFFKWPDLVFEEHACFGTELNGALGSCVGVGWMRGWTGQGPGKFFNIGDARVRPELRGGRLAEKLALRTLDQLPDEIGFGFWLVKKGNRPAARIAATMPPGRFRVRKILDFEAQNIVPFRRLSRPGFARVRRARLEDLPDMAELLASCYRNRLFAPMVTADGLAADLERLPGLPIEQYYVAERGGRLLGVLGAWDMTPFKRSVILRYTAWGQIQRAAHRLARMFFRDATSLPGIGEAFRSLSITRLAIADRNPAVLRDLLAAVIDDILGRGYHLVHIAFVGDDPLKKATRRTFAQRFLSELFINTSPDAGGPDPLAGRIDPYVDLAIV
jgi:hypothetical protein